MLKRIRENVTLVCQLHQAKNYGKDILMTFSPFFPFWDSDKAEVDYFIKKANKFYPTIKYQRTKRVMEGRGGGGGGVNPNSQSKFGQNPSPSGKFSSLSEIAIPATKILT